MNKSCWVAVEKSNGWKLSYSEDRHEDVKLPFLFMNVEHIKQAIRSNIVFVHNDENVRTVKRGLSVQAQNVLDSANLTLKDCRKKTDSELLKLKNCGRVTLQEIRNKQ